MLACGSAPAQDFLDVSDRKDMEELRDVRTQGKPGSFAFVKYRHVIDRHMGFFGQERDDSLLIGLLVVREHLGSST
jgi:hypothetical protein